MGVLQPMAERAAEQLAALLQEARTMTEFQRIQCVWLRAALALKATEIAKVVDWRADWVRQVQGRYRHEGEEALRDKPKGGRRHSLLTTAEEQALLTSFIEQAEQGQVAVTGPVRQVYENQLGRPVHHSVIYRALHRPGWRKVQPRPRHQKADRAAQEGFQKASGTGPRSSKAVGRRGMPGPAAVRGRSTVWAQE
jgi:transposase